MAREQATFIDEGLCDKYHVGKQALWWTPSLWEQEAFINSLQQKWATHVLIVSTDASELAHSIVIPVLQYSDTYVACPSWQRIFKGIKQLLKFTQC